MAILFFLFNKIKKYVKKKKIIIIKCVLFFKCLASYSYVAIVLECFSFDGSSCFLFVFKTSMKTVIKLFTFSLAVSFYRNIFLYFDYLA